MVSRCPSCGSPAPEEERLCSSCGWDFVSRQRGGKPSPPASKAPGTAEPGGFSLPAARNLNEPPAEPAAPSEEIEIVEEPKPKPPAEGLASRLLKTFRREPGSPGDRPASASEPASPPPAPAWDEPEAQGFSLPPARKSEAEDGSDILDLDAEPAPVSGPAAAPVPAPAKKTIPAAAPASGRKRILIVEDEPGYQELMESILIAGPFDLTICGSVEDAVVKIDTELYDLIITDINLLGLTGFEVLERMRKLDRLEVCPVVMCSSQFDPETKDKALEMGAAGFIPKPYQFEMVRSTVMAMLGVQF